MARGGLCRGSAVRLPAPDGHVMPRGPCTTVHRRRGADRASPSKTRGARCVTFTAAAGSGGAPQRCRRAAELARSGGEAAS